MPRAGTIFALSSGAPPAGIAVIRVSGPDAANALIALGGKLPRPRRATLRTLRDPDSGETLDSALTFWLPGPATATGEDIVELHAHGGRATVQALLDTLVRVPGLRAAEGGEFTRRAVMNGRMDVAEAEGLADLLFAETQSQRRAALHQAEGGLSRLVRGWQERLVALSAEVEALIDFADEGDVIASTSSDVTHEMQRLAEEWQAVLDCPPAERLRDGLRVVIAGPPNAGKSTLLNALASRDAAIVSPIAGTTRDVVEVPIILDGVPLVLTDTAGLRDVTDDLIEQAGIGRAHSSIDAADIVLWLGIPGDAPCNAAVCKVSAQIDRQDRINGSDIGVSACSGEGVEALRRWLIDTARQLVPRDGEPALNARHRSAVKAALATMRFVQDDLVIRAEQLRGARAELGSITGATATHTMLDNLFARFCVGK